MPSYPRSMGASFRGAGPAWVGSAVAVVVALLGVGACGGDDDATAPTGGTTGPTAATPDEVTTTTDAGTTTTAGVPPTDAGATTTATSPLPEVTTTVIGTAVGGNSGGVGADQTNSFSEAIRNPDGTCSGWSGPGGQWTQGLESGAPVRFFDDAGNQIGEGRVGTSFFEDADPGTEQWNCFFPFEGQVTGDPQELRIQVADLPAWRARRDPSDASRWVVSVDTTVQVDALPECNPPDLSGDAIGPWQAVRQFWANGIPSLCGAGFVIAGVERPCRASGFGSESIVLVTRADDPSVVIEDGGGIQVDVAELDVGTEVIVHVATGTPCG